MRKFPLWAIWALPALVLFMLIAFLLWHTALPHQAWRALLLSIAAVGTTPVGLAGGVLPTLFFFIRAAWQQGWSGMKQQWKQNVEAGLAVTGLFWCGLFLWHLIFPPLETFSADEIARFAQGIVIVRASADDASTLGGTGFWVDERGYAFICGDSKEPDADRAVVKIGMVMTPPLLTEKLLTVVTGVMYAPGQPIYYDPETGIKLVYVENNPFSRKFHGFAEAEDTTSHEVERIVEQYWVPRLSERNPTIGDPLFLAGVEPEDKDNLAMSVVEGQVVGLKADNSSSKRFLRINTSLLFKPSYCGAPVLSETKLLVGMVACVPGPTAVVIPARYLSDVLSEAGLR